MYICICPFLDRFPICKEGMLIIFKIQLNCLIIGTTWLQIISNFMRKKKMRKEWKYTKFGVFVFANYGQSKTVVVVVPWQHKQTRRSNKSKREIIKKSFHFSCLKHKAWHGENDATLFIL